MLLHDNRTKPESEWTFYVVDNLPSKSNIYRYDTVEEAIDKYKSLPKSLKSAIGSSIDGIHEIDHIHYCDPQNVLVTDCAKLSPWKDSLEIQESIDTMIAHLKVQHQLSKLFGNMYPSAIVDLERYSGDEGDRYFDNKLLRPDKPQTLFTAVQEVYAEGEGWMKLDAFLEKLDDSRLSRPGEGAKNIFVDRLNINYIDENGRCGQADLNPREFMRLLEKTQREISPEKLAEDLYQFSEDVDPFEANDQADTKKEEILLMKRDISEGYIGPYIKFLSDGLSEGYASEEDHKRALSLMSRFTVLTPPEFRDRSLLSMIRNAEHKAAQQQKDIAKPRWIDMEH